MSDTTNPKKGIITVAIAPDNLFVQEVINVW